MSGFRLELKKVLGDRRFWIFLAFLVVLQCFLLYRGEERGHGYSVSSYRAVYAQLGEMEPADAAAYAKGRLAVLEWLAWGGEEWSDIPKPEVDPAWPETLYTDREGLDYRLFQDVTSEVTGVWGRDDRIVETLRQADALQGVGLFQTQLDDYTKRNMEQTKADFLEATSIPVTGFAPEQGIRMALENGLGDAFVLLLLFLAVYLMVYQGYENGLEPVIVGSRLGRGRLLIWRGLAIAFCVGLVWVVLFLAGLICGALWYGLGDLGRPVQFLSDYVTYLGSINVGGLLFLVFWGKWLVFSVLGLILLVLVRLSRNMVAPSVGIFALFGLGYFVWQAVGDSSAWRLLRYVNLYYLLRPDVAFCVYRNLNVLGWPVAGRVIWLVSVLGTGGIGVGTLAATRHVSPESNRVRRKTALKKKERAPKPKVRSLLRTEFRKAWWVRHLAVLFVAVLVYQVWIYSEKEIWLYPEERVYRNYLNQWERELDGEDAELMAIVSEEETELMLGLAGQSKKYSMEAAQYILPAFSAAQGRVLALQEVAKAREERPYLFYEGVYDVLVDDEAQDTVTGCMAFLLILVAVTHMTGHEYQSGMRTMIQTTGRGRRRYLRDKMVVLLSICLMIMLVVYVPDLWLTVKTWEINTLGVPVYSLPTHVEFGLNISIGGYLVLMYVWRFVVLFLLGTLLLLGMERFRNEVVGLLVMGVVLGLPYLLYYISGAELGQWGLLRWLGFNEVMRG